MNASVKGRPTLFHHLFHSNLPPSEKTVAHISREGIVVVGAGSDTTGVALTVTTFHVLNKPKVLAKLKEELTGALPDPQASWPTLSELERLPYLSAVIKEGLRLAHGTSNRLPRVSRTSLEYSDWTIPPNTPVSVSPMLIHENEQLFPNRREFVPERWLGPGGKSLDRYLLAFGSELTPILFQIFLFCSRR